MIEKLRNFIGYLEENCLEVTRISIVHKKGRSRYPHGTHFSIGGITVTFLEEPGKEDLVWPPC